MTQPLIILGMHRSGTSMLTRMLAAQGLFVGRDVSKNAESLFFHAFNQQMLLATHAAWDRPGPALAAMNDRHTVERLASEIGGRLRGLRTWRYLGPRIGCARGAIGPHLHFAWGFKDPRTALFLPVWLRLFPEATLLRIRRHGIDVAASVAAREMARERPGACSTVAAALTLWTDYEDALDRCLAGVSPERQRTVRFEDYVTGFAEVQQRLGAFAGLPPIADVATLQPSADRCFAYRGDAGLKAEANRHANALRARGYEP